MATYGLNSEQRLDIVEGQLLTITGWLSDKEDTLTRKALTQPDVLSRFSALVDKMAQIELSQNNLDRRLTSEANQRGQELTNTAATTRQLIDETRTTIEDWSIKRSAADEAKWTTMIYDLNTSLGSLRS